MENTKTEKKPIKILCLHGFGTNGKFMEYQMR